MNDDFRPKYNAAMREEAEWAAALYLLSVTDSQTISLQDSDDLYLQSAADLEIIMRYRLWPDWLTMGES